MSHGVPITWQEQDARGSQKEVAQEEGGGKGRVPEATGGLITLREASMQNVMGIKPIL